MNIAAQRAAFFILSVFGICSPYLVTVIIFTTDEFSSLGGGWQLGFLRFLSATEALDEIWKIVLPLATTVLAAQYLSRQPVLEQVAIFFVFFLTYVLANVSVSIVESRIERLVSNGLSVENLSQSLTGIGQYCITVAVLMLGLKSGKSGDAAAGPVDGGAR